MSTLPQFARRDRDDVFALINQLLVNPYQDPPRPHLKELIAYEDGHFRAVFDVGYFILPEGQTEPSKSQWNTLKKRMKRHEPTLFIFKEHGVTGKHLYIDFGFFKDQARTDGKEKHTE